MKISEYNEQPASAVLDHIGPGANIIAPIALGEPAKTLDAIDEAGPLLTGVRVHWMDPYTSRPFQEGAYPGRLHHVDYFLGPGSRQNMWNGTCEFIPNNFSEIPELIRRYSKPTLAITQVSEMDEHGYFSMGTNADYTAAFIGEVPFFVEVNKNVPRTFGANNIHISQVVGITRNDRPLATSTPAEPKDNDRKIASIIAERVPDGACLQLGVGRLPNAILAAMHDHKHLGIHTENLSDGVMKLVEAGVADGSRKAVNRYKHVTTFATGSEELMKWLHNNPAVAFHPVDVVNSPRLVGLEKNMISINATSEVDLLGQAASETIAGRFWSGAGGQADFARAVRFSEGGKGFIVTQSQTSKGESRIKLHLTPGSAVTTHKNIIENVVTEWGIAELRGFSVGVRAKRLIAIAHPDHREELTRQARNVGLVGRLID